MIFGLRWRIEQSVDRPAVHEIVGDEAGEGEQALHVVLQAMGHADQQKGDQSDCDLNTDGIFRSSEEVPDFEGVLDPAKEQFDLPPPLIKFGDFVGRMRLPLVAAGEPFIAGFGVDPQLQVSRRLVHKTRSVQGGNQIFDYEFRIGLRNFRAGTTCCSRAVKSTAVVRMKK